MSGTDLITAERRRQIDILGYTPEHDAGHAPGVFAREAACYAEYVAMRLEYAALGIGEFPRPDQPHPKWPDDGCPWRAGDNIRTLVKAGALAAAEIDRLLAALTDDERARILAHLSTPVDVPPPADGGLGWCVLELMGHRRLTGYVTEQTVAGATFLRIDVPQPVGGPVTQLYSPSAVYAITPTTEDTARRAALVGRVAPVERWELLAAPAGPPVDGGFDGDEVKGPVLP